MQYDYYRPFVPLAGKHSNFGVFQSLGMPPQVAKKLPSLYHSCLSSAKALFSFSSGLIWRIGHGLGTQSLLVQLSASTLDKTCPLFGRWTRAKWRPHRCDLAHHLSPFQVQLFDHRSTRYCQWISCGAYKTASSE